MNLKLLTFLSDAPLSSTMHGNGALQPDNADQSPAIMEFSTKKTHPVCLFITQFAFTQIVYPDFV
ncbi:hypothetical protein D8682_18555 [Buttiauxella sp. 3AFRM03]|jgi:hypothetical protein|nr:hypothetical protein D8682_18555 [Buttiauxella sp. 3AFRM03]